MKILKIKSYGNYVYPATIAAAIKDANFLDSDSKPMTQGAINTLFKDDIDDLEETVENNEFTTSETLNDHKTRLTEAETELDELSEKIGEIDTALTSILGTEETA